MSRGKLESEILGEDHWKGRHAYIYRDDVALVFRYMRDHGPATGEEIAEACFPLKFGRSEPLWKRLFWTSMAKTLLSIQYMRGRGVAITLLSTPGDLSKFVLGVVPQGPGAISVLDARHLAVTVTAEDEMAGDLMGAWHGSD